MSLEAPSAPVLDHTLLDKVFGPDPDDFSRFRIPAAEAGRFEVAPHKLDELRVNMQEIARSIFAVNTERMPPHVQSRRARIATVLIAICDGPSVRDYIYQYERMLRDEPLLTPSSLDVHEALYSRVDFMIAPVVFSNLSLRNKTRLLSGYANSVTNSSKHKYGPWFQIDGTARIQKVLADISDGLESTATDPDSFAATESAQLTRMLGGFTVVRAQDHFTTV